MVVMRGKDMSAALVRAHRFYKWVHGMANRSSNSNSSNRGCNHSSSSSSSSSKGLGDQVAEAVVVEEQ
jgi:hypothetical protein